MSTLIAGTYAPTGGATAGQVIFRAVYTDKGVAGPTPLLSHTVERVAVRRSPVVRAVAADQSQGMTLRMEANGGVETMSAVANGYLVFKNIDLSGIRELRIVAQAPNREGFKGGTLEVRVGGLAGDLVGQATIGNAGVVAPDANAAQTAGRAPVPSAGPAPAVIPLRNVAGPRDLWIVARNFGAKPTEPVLSITAITFVQ
jgi:cytochrome c